MTVKDLLALDLEGNLPSLPTTALDVLRVCQDPEASIDELATALSLDPMLAGRVLQVANSAFYSRGGEVTSLQRAAVTLGMRALKVVALGFTLANDLPQRGSAAGLDLSAYWHRSLVNGVFARSLARVVDRAVAEEAFLCGLLSEIGKLALTQAMPEAYSAVAGEGHGWPSAELERERLGFSASEVAEMMLRRWGVPELIVLGASFAGRPGELPDSATAEARRLVDIVGLAQLGASVLFDQDAGGRMARFTEEAERRFSLAPDDVHALADQLEVEVRETAAFLSLELPAGVSYQALLQQARLEMVSMTVDAVMQLEQTARTVEVLERENEHLESLARTDALTGLPNRAALDAFLTQQVHQRLRRSLPGHLGLLMIDVDHFKRFNDTFGHLAGDEVLRSVAAALKQAARESDVLARYGGEEFCLIVPDGSPEALVVAGERLREAVAAAAVDLGPHGRQGVTVSLGGACLATVAAEGDAQRLTAAADAELYRAKEAGRNRVVVVSEPIRPG